MHLISDEERITGGAKGSVICYFNIDLRKWNYLGNNKPSGTDISKYK